MADAREEHVWTRHAKDDHFRIEPYTKNANIEHLMSKMDFKPETVMDVGCGSGLWRPVFKDVIYVGVEQNDTMLDAAVKHYPKCMCYKDPKIPGVADSVMSRSEYKDTFFVKYNARERFVDLFKFVEMPGYTGQMMMPQFFTPSLVFFSAVLQHNRESDKVEIFNNLKDFIVPGKYLMFTENTFTPTNFNPPFLRFEEGQTDGWSYTQKGWIDFVSKFGFEIIENEPFNFYLFRRT